MATNAAAYRRAPIVVRKAERTDRFAICRVHAASIREVCAASYTPAEIQAWTSHITPESYKDAFVTHAMVVACIDTSLVGFGQLHREAAEIDAVFVHPGHLASGVGSAILGYLEKIARGSGVTILKLSSTLNAVPFFERCGYERLKDVTLPVSPDVSLAAALMHKRIAR